jgi:hypothetical protein
MPSLRSLVSALVALAVMASAGPSFAAPPKKKPVATRSKGSPAPSKSDKAAKDKGSKGDKAAKAAKATKGDKAAKATKSGQGRRQQGQGR